MNQAERDLIKADQFPSSESPSLRAGQRGVLSLEVHVHAVNSKGGLALCFLPELNQTLRLPLWAIRVIEERT